MSRPTNIIIINFLTNETTLRVQSRRLRQVLHYPLLPQETHLVPLSDQVARLRPLLQDLHTGAIPEGAHLHPHITEAVQV